MTSEVSLSWKMRRFMAMGSAEVIWRVSQKKVWADERRAFGDRRPVHDVVAYGTPQKVDFSVLGLNLSNRDCSTGGSIELLGSYRYEDYRTRWHAAFQREGDWPVFFAADYDFGAEDVPGDVRTNWELNRCRQFALLAKSLYVTGDERYLVELESLFDSWNDANPFMWGPEWASPMEEAMRAVNWLVAATFLDAAGKGSALRAKLERGTYTMIAHVRRHYSRHSSANNHTIVEAAVVAVAALAFDEEAWLAEAVRLLDDELRAQTHSDGVNKEQALHYQLFAMEAACLVLHCLGASGREVPDGWMNLVSSMARYVVDCRAGEGAYIEFGDDDGGTILCLSEEKPCYADYVLALCTMELGLMQRWSSLMSCCETLQWLYTPEAIMTAVVLPSVAPRHFAHFPAGGVTVMRSADGRLVAAFDHGPLGLGSLAAHGHADALSVQLWVDGSPFLADPGTYVYNGDPEMRRGYRSTIVHNTVCLGNRDQSEQTGPFLWGRKAEASLISADETSMRVCASHNGYEPTIHKRSMRLLGNQLLIEDSLESANLIETVANYLLVGCEVVEAAPNIVRFSHVSGAEVAVICERAVMELCLSEWSTCYLQREPALALKVHPEGPEWNTTFIVRGESR